MPCISFKDGSSRLEAFCTKSVLENFAKFTGKHLCQGQRLFNQVVGLKPGIGVFLWILQNFQEHLFRRTPAVAASVRIYILHLGLPMPSVALYIKMTIIVGGKQTFVNCLGSICTLWLCTLLNICTLHAFIAFIIFVNFQKLTSHFGRGVLL